MSSQTGTGSKRNSIKPFIENNPLKGKVKVYKKCNWDRNCLLYRKESEGESQNDRLKKNDSEKLNITSKIC